MFCNGHQFHYCTQSRSIGKCSQEQWRRKVYVVNRLKTHVSDHVSPFSSVLNNKIVPVLRFVSVLMLKSNCSTFLKFFSIFKKTFYNQTLFPCLYERWFREESNYKVGMNRGITYPDHILVILRTYFRQAFLNANLLVGWNLLTQHTTKEVNHRRH